jgi:hypothetical protein
MQRHLSELIRWISFDVKNSVDLHHGANETAPNAAPTNESIPSGGPSPAHHRISRYVHYPTVPSFPTM